MSVSETERTGFVSSPPSGSLGRREPIDARVARLFQGGDVIVDAGCGDGRPLDWIGLRYKKAIGFDVSTERLALRLQDRNGWTFVLADLNRGIPLTSASVDAVHANQVIEHIANPLAFALEVHRVLKPGGLFVAATPNIRYLRHVWRLLVRGEGPMTSGNRPRTPENWDMGHIHFFTPNDLHWIAKHAGFSDVRTSALIATGGSLAPLRRLLDRSADAYWVKNFLSGNTLLVATK